MRMNRPLWPPKPRISGNTLRSENGPHKLFFGRKVLLYNQRKVKEVLSSVDSLRPLMGFWIRMKDMPEVNVAALSVVRLPWS